MNQSNQFFKSMTILENDFFYVTWDRSNYFEVFDLCTDGQIFEFQLKTSPVDEEAAIDEIEFLI